MWNLGYFIMKPEAVGRHKRDNNILHIGKKIVLTHTPLCKEDGGPITVRKTAHSPPQRPRTRARVDISFR